MSEGIITIEQVGEQWRVTANVIAPFAGDVPVTENGGCKTSALYNLHTELREHGNQTTVETVITAIQAELG